ncbi:MAG: S8 family peptidase [Desulfovibrio sp.]|jgi:hypothetical protein|nr:S8 family peptidase [Desulfovibrio sp.]
MAERPLLLFPTPNVARRAELPPAFPRVHKPSLERQWERTSPKLQQLQNAFAEQRVKLQQGVTGIEPEQVLVIETIGSIAEFANAVRQIQGMEWLAEIEGADVAPDDDFYDERKREKKLGVQLYMVMSNQRALEEMLSLWKKYKENPQLAFKRGLAKFRDVFNCLHDIRRWGIQERLLETGLLEAWRQELANDPSRNVRFETELWFRQNPIHRAQRAEQVVTLIRQINGRVVSQATIEEISYHAILGELPAADVRAIIENPNTELTLCDSVMFFRPVGQMTIGTVPAAEETEAIGDVNNATPAGEPVIALFDGMPLANHRLLAGRLIIDDPDNFEASYTAAERVHGTSMASLIVHGDLSIQSSPLNRPVYVRPIMKPIPWFNQPRPELMPEDRLVVDLIHSAVKRLFEGENGEPPVAPYVRVINLSIGDERRPFIRAISPFARLLDWLSAKYGVLFIVSAGNHATPIEFDPSLPPIRSLSADDLERAVVTSIYGNAWNRRLLSPAEAINPITVGALHHDGAPDLPHSGTHRINPLNSLLPSPISAFGSGYSRSIKPDLLYSGGRQSYPLPLTTTSPQKIELRAPYRKNPGNKFASPSVRAGDLNATVYGCGTSNAAALMSRNASICYETLAQIFEEQLSEEDVRRYEIPLLKAMLVHGCSWGNIGTRLINILNNAGNGTRAKQLACNWLGYGAPDIGRVLECTEQRATLLGFGELTDGQAHVFTLPLPPSLSARRDRRRLTVTLAWLSPIAAQTQKYRGAGLWFEINGTSPTQNRQEACGGQDGWRTVRRGTVQHEIFEGVTAEPIADGDSISIQVNCRKDARRIVSPIPYGLVVSLEVAEGIDIPIYNEIRTRIAPAIQIQQTRA